MKHILILFTDEQRPDTIHALGNEVIQTPNLDALARDSVVFENCITPSPVCVPARLSLFTGQYPARTGCNINNKETVYEGNGFYSQITEEGYQSCCIGKMHHLPDLYGPMGFEKRLTQEGTPNVADDYANFVREKYPHVFDYHGMRSEMYYVPQISPLPPSDHPTQWVGDRSVEYIEACDPERPMFLMSSFYHPHPPFSPPAPWNKLYREDPQGVFAPDAETLADYKELLGNNTCERLMMSEQDVLRLKNYYYACISFVDYQIGRIIKALKDKGMYEDTLIIFTSDHGEMIGDYHALGKRTMMDPACRVPFLVHYPGVKPETRKVPCSLVDVAPTVLSYIGADYDKASFDGIDLFSDERHDYVYSQYGSGKKGTYMVTDGQNKLVLNTATDRYFFFDTVPNDRNTYDLSNPKVQELKAALDAYRDSDVNRDSEAVACENNFKKHPHYSARHDQVLFHDEEAAAIPEGYRIDL